MPPEVYGPFGALVVLVTVIAMVIRGDLVPGFIYRGEKEQRMKAEAQAERNAEALTVLAKAAADGLNGGSKRG